ncbi:Mur ligase domain-containing protein [Streptomyces hokutonensis]|uniref:Mur ligase domain-containing protein n=1 Tax=Streptomyces hokutonensis TaxID=1306990 RepID=UPI00381E605A
MEQQRNSSPRQPPRPATRTLRSRRRQVTCGPVDTPWVARGCAERGCTVTGSDIRDSSGPAALAELGVGVFSGHEAGHVPVDASAVVFTGAVRDDNSETLRAKELRVPVVHR